MFGEGAPDLAEFPAHLVDLAHNVTEGGVQVFRIVGVGVFRVFGDHLVTAVHGQRLLSLDLTRRDAHSVGLGCFSAPGLS